MQYLERGGIKLAYEMFGSGAPAVVLIHGWCDDHTMMEGMAAHFGLRHQVLSVDLRGHGQSDKPESDYSVAAFADDMAWMCDRLDIRQPLIIGHGLGGAVARDLAACYFDLPAAIVALEGVILSPDAAREAGQSLAEALRTPAWREAMRGFIDAGFTPTDDPELRRKAHAELEHLPQHMLASVAEQMLFWDAATAAETCRVPALYIEAGSGLSDLDQFKALCPQLMVGKTFGVDHQLVATPEQVNAMIDRFIAIELCRDTVPTAWQQSAWTWRRDSAELCRPSIQSERRFRNAVSKPLFHLKTTR
ncbi:MAG: alpha/beta hydrolase [Acidobacteriota bacterium]|nr:alpha/beta hydrolase [Acidobacteriota bacterium]